MRTRLTEDRRWIRGNFFRTWPVAITSSSLNVATTSDFCDDGIDRIVVLHGTLNRQAMATTRFTLNKIPR
jgi:hypothetical protein